jgi:hypothetical protein
MASPINTILGATLQTVGQQLVAAMQKQLQANGSNATGFLSKSIQSEVRQGDKGPEVVITMAPYGPVLDSGRDRSTKGGPKQTWRNKIIVWQRVRGIAPRQGISDETLAFLITRKINREGYKAKPFIGPAFNLVVQNDLPDLISKGIQDALSQTLVNEVKIKLI